MGDAFIIALGRVADIFMRYLPLSTMRNHLVLRLCNSASCFAVCAAVLECVCCKGGHIPMRCCDVSEMRFFSSIFFKNHHLDAG